METSLGVVDIVVEENVEKLLSQNLIEKKLIKPIYFS